MDGTIPEDIAASAAAAQPKSAGGKKARLIALLILLAIFGVMLAVSVFSILSSNPAK